MSDIRRCGLYQPLFLIGLFLIVVSWTLVGLLSGRGIESFAESVFGFLFAVFSSLTVFAFWKFYRGDGRILLVFSYLICLFIFPLAWIVVFKTTTYFYALIVTNCCRDSEILNVEIWGGLYLLINGWLTPIIFCGFLVYISLWLSNNKRLSASFKLIAKAISVASVLLFFIGAGLSIHMATN